MLFLELPLSFLSIIYHSACPTPLSLLSSSRKYEIKKSFLLFCICRGVEFWSHKGCETKISVDFGRAVFQTKKIRELGFIAQ